MACMGMQAVATWLSQWYLENLAWTVFYVRFICTQTPLHSQLSFSG